MSVEYVKKVHRYSGIVLAVFFLFHTINHLCAWGGADLHIRVMKLFRIVYRFPPVEVLLLFSALVQVIAGLMLVWKKGFRKDRYHVMQIGSGLYLSFFLFYHIRAVMLARYKWNVETDFHFAAWGVKNSPADLFFIPYYSLSVLCVFIHLGCVHYQKSVSMERQANVVQRSPGHQALAIMLSGVVVTILILASFIRA